MNLILQQNIYEERLFKTCQFLQFYLVIALNKLVVLSCTRKYIKLSYLKVNVNLRGLNETRCTNKQNWSDFIYILVRHI